MGYGRLSYNETMFDYMNCLKDEVSQSLPSVQVLDTYLKPQTFLRRYESEYAFPSRSSK